MCFLNPSFQACNKNKTRNTYTYRPIKINFYIRLPSAICKLYIPYASFRFIGSIHVISILHIQLW